MKTREELQRKVDLDDAFKVERAASDGLYAQKIVERIVFWFVIALATGVLGLIGKLAIDYFSQHYHP